MATDLPPVDENVRVPAAVKAAAAAAEATHAQAYQTEAKPTGDAPASDGDAFIQIHDTTPPPLPKVSTPGGEKTIIPKNPQTAPLAAAQGGPATNPNDEKITLQLPPKPAEAQPPATREFANPEEELAYLRQYQRSVQGRAASQDRQLSQTQEQLAQMSQEVVRLSQLVARQPAPQPQQGQPAAPTLPAGEWTQEDIDKYGREALEVMERAAQRRLAPVLDKFAQAAQALDQRTRQIGETVQQSEQQRIFDANWAALRATFTNPEEINNSDGFKQWLSLPDVYSGIRKSELLNRAFAAGDSGRVVRFFKDYVAEANAQANPGTQAGSQPAPQGPAFSLAALAAPGPVKQAPGTQSPGPAEKRTYTHQDISQFYDAVRRGYYAGRDAERQAWEQDIFNAQKEGRVR